MDGSVLRPAVPGDLEDVAACARAAYQKYVARIGKEPAPMVADFRSLIASGEVHVLVFGAAVAGFIVLRPGADHLFVENVAVHPDRQGHGFGRQLMAFAQSMAVERGLPALKLYTNVKMTGNFPFYESLGFIETEHRREDGFDRVYMSKKLNN